MGKTYTGFDIGTDTLKVAVCDGSVIKDILLAPVPEGMVAEGRIVSTNAMADYIKETVRGMKGLVKQAAFVIPQSDSLTRRLQIPAMTTKELDINLPYEFRDYITQGKDKYIYDYSVLNANTTPDGTPESFDLLAVAAPKLVISDFTEMFRRAGFKLAVAMPVAAALQNLIRGNTHALANCCIIDFSYSETVLHFFTNASYDVSRAIELGLSDINRAVAEKLNVDIHTASSYRENNFQDVLNDESVRSIYDNIAIEVSRALNFYSFNNPDSQIEVAYLSGEGMLVRPLIDAVSTQVEIDKVDIAEIMPQAQHNEFLRTQCPETVGVTLA